MKTMLRIVLIGCAAAILLSACGRQAASTSTPLKPPAFMALLDTGWDLACTIKNDKDRAKTQQKVVKAALDAADPERALEWTGGMEGWRKRVSLAETAAWLALHDRKDRALKIVRGIEGEGRKIEGWQYDRVQMHLLETKAYLGMTNETSKTMAFYAPNRDCYGPSSVYHALAMAREGRKEDALNIMQTLSETNFFDTLVWRVKGYKLLADEGHLEPGETDAAMGSAWKAVRHVPGPIQHELRTDILRTWSLNGNPNTVRAHIGQVFTNLTASRISGHITVPMMAELAIEYGRLGDEARIDELKAVADPLVKKDLMGTEYYLVNCLFGEAYFTAGNRAKAEPLYRLAAEQVYNTTNPRPRAMAAVDLALSMFRCEYDDETIVEGLNTLLADFHAKMP